MKQDRSCSGVNIRRQLAEYLEAHKGDEVEHTGDEVVLLSTYALSICGVQWEESPPRDFVDVVERIRSTEYADDFEIKWLFPRAMNLKISVISCLGHSYDRMESSPTLFGERSARMVVPASTTGSHACACCTVGKIGEHYLAGLLCVEPALPVLTCDQPCRVKKNKKKKARRLERRAPSPAAREQTGQKEEVTFVGSAQSKSTPMKNGASAALPSQPWPSQPCRRSPPRLTACCVYVLCSQPKH
jgi:hypothetical protein